MVENHWSGEFQELRGRRAKAETARIDNLARAWGFEQVEVLETALRFPSTSEAERILGWLCGEDVRKRLRKSPTVRISHNVVLMRWAPG